MIISTPPVLLLVFNRLDTTKQVFDAIRQSKPSRLYVASDGAREKKEGETIRVQSVRQYVLDHIDWQCEVKTLFREKNLGCKMAVSGAITWFFEHEEMGIILEDDCLPSASFFHFCGELLEKYKHDLRVWHISGVNFNNGFVRDPDYSYYFSDYCLIWGWATWKSRWQKYSIDMANLQEIKKKGYLLDILGNKREAAYWENNFDSIKTGLDTWDYQWAYISFINRGLSIIPSRNLVNNIGFDAEATHTKSKPKWFSLVNEEIDPVLKHPPFMIRDMISDSIYSKNTTKGFFLMVIKEKIKKLLGEKLVEKIRALKKRINT